MVLILRAHAAYAEAGNPVHNLWGNVRYDFLPCCI